MGKNENDAIASLACWLIVKLILKLLKELCAAFVITLVVYIFFPGLLDKLGPGAFIRDSYADLLGFTIGVYALFFVIPERPITLIEKIRKLSGLVLK